MRKLVEVNDEGLDGLLGEVVTLLCANYFYTGKLIGVNETCVKLGDPKIVYETGAWSDSSWSDAQALPGDVYVQTAAIEAFGIMKK